MQSAPRRRRVRLALLAAWVGSFGLLGGCMANSLFLRSDTPEFDGRADGPAIENTVGPIVEYLDIMRALVEGDPVQQVDAFLEVASAAAEEPTITNQLKLAFAVAMPGHPSSDPAEAQQRLGELLSTGSTLTPEERTLVAIHLKEVEQRLVLDAEAERQRQAADAAREARTNDDAQRLEALRTENTRLARELQEALQKLDAITSIERSIRERENGADSQ